MMFKSKEKNREYQKNWSKNHSLLRQKISKEWRQRNKIIVLQVYSNGYMKCANCGYDENINALVIDHIYGGGTKQQRESNTSLHRWLIKNNFPFGFQVLCANCNTIKALEIGR